jgi:hypothetical protein
MNNVRFRMQACAFPEEIQMRAYVITTGIAFGVLVVVHILRPIEEGPQLLKEPPFIITTVAAAALFVWAMTLLRRPPRA